MLDDMRMLDIENFMTHESNDHTCNQLAGNVTGVNVRTLGQPAGNVPGMAVHAAS